MVEDRFFQILSNVGKCSRKKSKKDYKKQLHVHCLVFINKKQKFSN